MLKPGQLGTASLIVSDSDLASRVALESSDKYPAVFATARMFAVMEVAASRVLQPLLGEGEVSVGVSADIGHSAPTPLGAIVTATARFVGQEGKLFVFEVQADDGAGEIGRGTHKRAIVREDKIMEAAGRRMR